MRKVELLPTRYCEAGCSPAQVAILQNKYGAFVYKNCLEKTSLHFINLICEQNKLCVCNMKICDTIKVCNAVSIEKIAYYRININSYT